MYAIETQDFGNYTVWVLTNPATGAKATIIPEHGAMLQSLHLPHQGNLYSLVEGYEDLQDRVDHHNTAYKSAVLFPFPNRINAGRYEFQGSVYQLETNEVERGHALHGLIHDKAFRVSKEIVAEDKAEVWLEYIEDGSLAAYPFKVKIVLVYRFGGNKLEVGASVQNIDIKPVPVGLGWHPCFQLNDKPIDELSIWFPEGNLVSLGEGMIPTGNTTAQHSYKGLHALLGLDMDMCLQVTGDVAVTSIYDFEAQLALHVWQKASSLGYVQIYTPSHRRSLAIEAQTCAADAFNNKMGLLELQPNQKFNTHWGVSFGASLLQ
ncbi:MAG TPA: aldose 1-epimerase [Cytophagales bacterium]|nr:aldose 1-epimerase [Cytophagales bacterium]